MNTKMELEAQMKELENKLSEMKATINGMKEEKKSFKRWRAENDNIYYFIGDDGTLHNRLEGYVDKCNYLYNLGNYYKTKEEAEKARDLQLAIVRVNDAINEANEGWVADYSGNDDKFIIHYSHISNKYMFDIYCLRLDFSYKLKECKSKEIAERIINEFTSDLNLIFNVK